MQIKIIDVAEISSALVCSICYLYKPSYLNRWFISFLWLTVAVELTAAAFKYSHFKTDMYNCFYVVEFMFYLSFLRSLLEFEKGKILLKYLIWIFIIFSLIDVWFLWGLYAYTTHTKTLGAVLVIAVCLYHYIEMVNNNDDVKENLRWPLFCVATGLLVFYSANLFTDAVYTHMSITNPKGLMKLIELILPGSNVTLYGLFTVAFFIEIYEQKVVGFKADIQPINEQ